MAQNGHVGVLSVALLRTENGAELTLATRPEDDFNANAAVVRADVLVLLREKRYEEALAVLYRARSESPESLELQRSIDQIKEFLVGAYAKRLGGLDQIARPIPVGTPRSPDVVLLSRYIDGRSTFGDLAQMSPLGQLRTLQVLVGVYPKVDLPAASDKDGPRSGLRAPSSIPTPRPSNLDEERVPDTARSASFTAPHVVPQVESVPVSVVPVPISVAPVETEEMRAFKAEFAKGTAAFIQNRFQDAVEAFESCVRMRPDDNGAAAMLRRSLRDLGSR